MRHRITSFRASKPRPVRITGGPRAAFAAGLEKQSESCEGCAQDLKKVFPTSYSYAYANRDLTEALRVLPWRFFVLGVMWTGCGHLEDKPVDINV